MQKEGESLRAKIAAGLACLALALAAALLPVRRAEGEAETPGQEGYYGADADIRETVKAVTAQYTEPAPGAAARLQRVLEVMLYAYRSSVYKRKAELLSSEF